MIDKYEIILIPEVLIRREREADAERPARISLPKIERALYQIRDPR